MQKLAVSLVVLVASLLLAESSRIRRADGKYTSRYDSVNLDDILGNDRLFDKYYDCLMARGPCTPDASLLKETIPDALATNCAKCTDKQKEGVKKVMTYMYVHKRKKFDQLRHEFDKDDVYFNKYKEQLEEDKRKELYGNTDSLACNHLEVEEVLVNVPMHCFHFEPRDITETVLLVRNDRQATQNCPNNDRVAYCRSSEMQKLAVVLVVLVAALALAESSRVRREDDKYTTKYDDVDLDEILHSDRLVKNYVDCLMERGKCTPDGTELKEHVSDALETDCAKCSDKQKEGARKVLKFLYKNKPDMWKELSAKYDPKGEYEKKHEAELKD
ncbi:uncharacterized protein [Periplaneta americana]|uniref:uncharacterized protein n=1 Tax=Periplaneta americana TaxID=6978 RepID=UPI0037E99149